MVIKPFFVNFAVFRFTFGSHLESLTLCINGVQRSEEHTSELQSQSNLVCRLLLEKKKLTNNWLSSTVVVLLLTFLRLLTYPPLVLFRRPPLPPFCLLVVSLPRKHVVQTLLSLLHH